MGPATIYNSVIAVIQHQSTTFCENDTFITLLVYSNDTVQIPSFNLCMYTNTLKHHITNTVIQPLNVNTLKHHIIAQPLATL